MIGSPVTGPQDYAAQVARIFKSMSRKPTPLPTDIRASRRTRFPQEISGSAISEGTGSGELATTDASITTELDETATWANSRQWMNGRLSAVNTGTPGQIALDMDSLLAVATLPGTGQPNVIYWQQSDDTFWIDTDGLGSWVPVGSGGGGSGDVVGPASAIDNSIPTYDGTTGKLIKDIARWKLTTGGILTGLDGSGNVVFEIHTSTGAMLAIAAGLGTLIHGAKLSGDIDYRVALTPASLGFGDGSNPADAKFERKDTNLGGMASGDSFYAGEFAALNEIAAPVYTAFIDPTKATAWASSERHFKYRSGASQTRDMLGNLSNLGAVAPAAIANTAVQTQFAGASNILANELGVLLPGATLRLFAEGTVRNFPDPVADTLVWYITFTGGGAVNVFATAVVPIAGAFQPAVGNWQLDARMTLIGVGAGVPTLLCAGWLTWTDPLALSGSVVPAWSPPFGNTLAGPFNIDTTVAQAVSIGVLWNNASPGNSVSLRQFHVDKS